MGLALWPPCLFGAPSAFAARRPKIVVALVSHLLKVPIEDRGAREISERGRGTPRIANRLLRRVIDFAVVEGDGNISYEMANTSLTKLGVDDLGLDDADRRYLKIIAQGYRGGPVGIETLAAALTESRDAIEEVIEPYLLQKGLLQRTPRGRMLTDNAWTHLKLEQPKQVDDLFSK